MMKIKNEEKLKFDRQQVIEILNESDILLFGEGGEISNKYLSDKELLISLIANLKISNRQIRLLENQKIIN